MEGKLTISQLKPGQRHMEETETTLMKYQKCLLVCKIYPNMSLLQVDRCVSACVHANVSKRSAF